MKNNACLSTHTLYHSYSGRSVLQGVSFSVSKGSVVGLLGPNGAGKTTSFNIIAGLLSPQQGTVLWQGRDITHWRMDRRGRLGIRYLPQEPSVFQGLTVEENLMMIIRLVQEDIHVGEKLLEEFHLTKIRKTLATALSGGERRRLEIARSLIGQPEILLLDEPLAGIDPKGIEELQELIPKLVSQYNLGVLITDHNVHAALHMVDRAYILLDGRVAKEGTPKALAEDSYIRRAYLGQKFQLYATDKPSEKKV